MAARLGIWLGGLLIQTVSLIAPVIAAPTDAVVVTATRIPEPSDQIPADISLISGDELVARGALDIAHALSLVPGVEAPAGGDAGPSSAVPSFWGLHEFDAFLLVVDGIPWGGAFNPGITTLDFNNIERVEVLKGAAPVMYGATSFVGVVQTIHYPAGKAAQQADLAYGDFGSVRGSASWVLPQLKHYRQSLAISGQSGGFADARERVAQERILYRGELDWGLGKLRVDADLSKVRDVPASPVIRVGSTLNLITPINANFNPADARIDVDKYHIAVGYSLPIAGGTWNSLASFAYSDITDIRAFLHADLSGSADTQSQHRSIDDGYLDTHAAVILSRDATLIAGTDLLYGLGRQKTFNGNAAFTLPLNGSVLPPVTSALQVNEIGVITDRRLFAGQYAQIDWKPDEHWDVLSGLRLNETYEHKTSSDLILLPPQFVSGSTSKTLIRPSETIGVSYRQTGIGKAETVIYADYRNAFKPSAIDFGPDYRPQLLSPETAQSYEAGVKGVAANGRLNYQAELFLMRFSNLVVATGSGTLANAAGEKLRGIELETRYQVTADLLLAASASYHDAQFTKYLFNDGESSVDVAGKQLVLSPHVLASAGFLYTPSQGFGSIFIAKYVGRRFLDEKNSARQGGYTTLDATLSDTFGRWRMTLEGTNLTDRRPPVSASEFGSQSFYLLAGRMLWLRLAYHWR